MGEPEKHNYESKQARHGIIHMVRYVNKDQKPIKIKVYYLEMHIFTVKASNLGKILFILIATLIGVGRKAWWYGRLQRQLTKHLN